MTMTMSVELDERLESFVKEMVGSGRYNSRVDVLREGLLLLQHREARLKAFDAAIDRGLADIEAGRFMSIEDAR
jgi:antitoxin ParD1/3/4